ncbi:S9 family peptidase [Rhizohabitans arisaemae]|uniref:S9 family peptidase n=1 Tax=Rhizohabitans arisaemae TaxID=2720610 RepID=UPI0024B24950|nr:DPP IV N-terminal domain-containing protein [Rhizohabitans arisaemae]
MTVDYARAERCLPHNRESLVFGDRVDARWDGDRFLYFRRTRRGDDRFLLVDPATATAVEAFDHKRLAAALGVDRIPFEEAELSGEVLTFELDGKKMRCDLGDYTCEVTGEAPDLGAPVSPDGKWAAFVRDHDLWVREIATGREHRLTHDGEADRAYAETPDAARADVLMETLGLTFPPALVWSPDSTRIATHRLDLRNTTLAHLLDSIPAGGGHARLRTLRYPTPGAPELPTAELVVAEVPGGRIVRAQGDPIHMEYLPQELIGLLWWSEDGRRVYLLDEDRHGRRLTLYALDPGTGGLTVLAEEHAETRIDPTAAGGRITRVLADGRVLWYSQRDGWGHLYLLADGRETRVTSGEWAVQEVLHVDEKAGTVLFTASGLVPGDPYPRQILCVGLDGTGLRRLTDDRLDHSCQVSPGGAYLVDTASDAATPPVTVLRDRTGQVVLPLETADTTALAETGWTSPERFAVTAADGVTTVYGVLHPPYDFDPAKRYPVIDHVYPGPQVKRVPLGFGDDEVDALRALGFAVVTLDGRGTPGRDKAFHDLSYGRMGGAGFLEDHVAGIRELAATRPWLDLSRVGIIGHSGGGYAAARAMLTHPEFFHVAVSISGNHDMRYYQAGWGEPYHGPYDAESYREIANVTHAERLRGRLLLIHGELDDNVTPQHTMALADAFIQADKDFDLLIVPGTEHSLIGRTAYVTRRGWDHFVRHLHGVEPPRGHRLTEPPFQASKIRRMFG